MAWIRRTLVWQLLAKDLLQYLRQPAATFFTFAFPSILLVMLGSLNSDGQPIPGGADLGGILVPEGLQIQYIDFFFPGFIVFVATNICLNSVPVFLAYQREAEYFRALQVSAVPLYTVMLIRIAVYGLIFLASMALVLLEARLMFDLRLHGSWLLVALAAAVCFVSFGAAGFLIGGLLQPQSTQAIASVVFFVLYFSSGSAIPRFLFPDWLYQITNANPMVYGVQGLTRLWLGSPFREWGLDMLVIVIMGAICIPLTLRTFKWGGDTR